MAFRFLLPILAFVLLLIPPTCPNIHKSRRRWTSGTALPKPRSKILIATRTSRPPEDVFPIPIQFKLWARNVMKKDRNGASDPYVVVTYTQDNGSGEISLGKTAVAMDTANPNWSDVFNVTYVPGSQQKIHFFLWDKDSGQDDRVGQAWVFLGDYVRNGEYAQRYLNPGFLIMEKA